MIKITIKPLTKTYGFETKEILNKIQSRKQTPLFNSIEDLSYEEDIDLLTITLKEDNDWLEYTLKEIAEMIGRI